MSARKFMVLLNGLTERSALGQKIKNDFFEKEKKKNNYKNNQNSRTHNIDPKNKGQVNNLETIFRGLSKIKK